MITFLHNAVTYNDLHDTIQTPFLHYYNLYVVQYSDKPNYTIHTHVKSVPYVHIPINVCIDYIQLWLIINIITSSICNAIIKF
jgi:hypothetical protein